MRRRLAALPWIALTIACETAAVPVPDAGSDAAPDVFDAGPIGEACGNICEAEKKLCPADVAPDCVEACAVAPMQAGDCEEVLGAYITCLGEHSEEMISCLAADYPPACKQAHDAYLGCGHRGGCGPVECKDVGEGACSCDAICSGVTYTEACTQVDGGFDCTCSANGQLDKSCPGLPNGCAFFVGCCADELP